MEDLAKRITQLHRLRGALKTKATVFEKFLNKSTGDIDIIELRGKIENTSIILENFEKTQTELEEIVAEDHLESEYQWRSDFEENFSALCAKAQGILNEKESGLSENLSSNASSSRNSVENGLNINNEAAVTIGVQQPNANVINLKLPALNLPIFSGSYEQWPGFSDIFKSSVEIDPRFTDSQRLIYLRSCLTGRAADKIESIQTTDANYKVAWNILEKCYDDPSTVINNHIKSFFELPNCHNTSAVALGDLLNNVTKHYRALEALRKPFLEAFPIYAIVSKLDSQTRLKWKEHCQSNEAPTMEQLLEFLHSRERILETNKSFSKNEKSEKNISRNENQYQSHGNRLSQPQSNFKKQSVYSIQTRAFCHICKEAHFTQNCEKLLNATLPERFNIVKNQHLCFNCLRSNHTVENCNASACKTCSKRHHTLLHQDNKSTKPLQTNHASAHTIVSSQVLLSTAIVHIIDHKGNPQSCRALLDNGSQVNFITEKLAAKLGLEHREIEIPLGGVNQMSSSVSKITRTTIQSRLNKYSADLTFLITPEVNDHAPSEPLNRVALKIPPKIHLADPDFHKPSEIDILIGAEIFLKLLCIGQISLANDNVTLQKTHFGWILGGKTPGNVFPKAAKCNLSLNSLHNKIAQFWEIENGPNKKLLSKEENACERHFQENTRRDPETGRYIVKLPFKEDSIELGESYSQAFRRFNSLERSMAKNSEFKDKYIAFMREYMELDHMCEDKSASLCDGYFLPHHAVIKQSSLTTKLRSVFDASAKTSNGRSLNDILMVGPNIQDDLFSLLVRFRSHTYAITADIEKMYRQIRLDEADRNFQKILWREDPCQPIKIYKLKTVTYGMAPASFLATRSLIQLANDEVNIYQNVSTTLKEDFYMDDLLSGARTFEEAKQLISGLMQVTRKGGMNLRQWASNEPDLITSLSEESDESYLCLNLGDTTKTLGIYWNPRPDSFVYTVKQSDIGAPVTKRTILSEIAQLFDPLGLLGPVILPPKIIMQSLWQLNIGWDESVPLEVATSWLEHRKQLIILEEIEINRKIVVDDYVSLQIHGFCDASEKAYGACIYIRSTDKNGEHSTRLVCSKSRVAPLKFVSLPRLELCSALLLSKLYATVNHALRRLNIEKTILWSDSTIALLWIKSPSNTLKTFEGNRVEEIQTLTQSLEWRHVRTEYNPADHVSRGLTPKEFIANSYWFNGPVWINEPEENWPISHLEPIEVPGRKKPVVSLAVKLTRVNEIATTLFEKAQSFTKLIRVIAYCQRFINVKVHKREIKGHLSSNELKTATNCVIKLLQNETFPDEIKILESEKTINGRLAPLSPFLDSEGILRVGGRLKQSDLNYSQRHPALLPQNHNITTLIIREQHLKLMHAGSQATLNATRDSYWIINGKNTVKNVIRKCIICCRAKPQAPTYLMGDLPKNRTVFKKAFLHSGVDYCGPFYIKEKKFRNRNKVKIYVAVFVCFATKSVHIEVVSDLTTEAFLACLSRFFSRRGKSSDLYSDNGSNFVGAKNEIDAICKFLNSKEHNDTMSRVLSNHQINWHFIPPRSPHFGGLWEAAVKSFKHHWVRVIGERLLTYEEFTTLATEIEGILNSRPLTPVPSDPNDLAALTPGHFLTGDSLTGVPEHDLEDMPSRRLSSWQQVQQIKQHFWTRWNKEYLHELTVRKKWHKGSTTNIQIGKLVTIRDDNLPPMRWALGRVIATHPGEDGVIRVVTLKTANGECKRSVKNLSPLPIDTD